MVWGFGWFGGLGFNVQGLRIYRVYAGFGGSLCPFDRPYVAGFIGSVEGFTRVLQAFGVFWLAYRVEFRTSEMPLL